MGRRTIRKSRKGTFNPEDETHVKHTRIGPWDFYEEIHPELARIPGSSRLETYLEMAQCLPYFWRMIKDLGRIRSCWNLLSLYLFLEIVVSLIPAINLWFSGQLLNVVETALRERTVDKELLLRIAAGRVFFSVSSGALRHIMYLLKSPLNQKIKQHYSIHIFHSMSRLDVPTFEDPIVQRQLEAAFSSSGRSSIAWDAVVMASGILTTMLRFASQLGVLITVLNTQRDGVPLAILSFSISLMDWMSIRTSVFNPRAWAATTKDKDYIRMQGLKRVVNDSVHRKEIVAGEMADHLLSEYKMASARVGDNVGDFHELHAEYLRRGRLSLMSLTKDALRELPEVAFALRAIQYPSYIPLSLASLNLIRETSNSFTLSVFSFLDQTGSIAEQLSSIRKLYEIVNIRNVVEDGMKPFPENQQTLNYGISIEFKNVSFQYPGSSSYALRDVSFKIEQGQLCIIVGTNGSGKSTILKLLSRLYDPTKGQILIDGHDIRTLKLSDLRRAMSVLFQDYTHFPLSIKENIGLGDPENAHDEDKIREAARLGGAEDFIQRLPDGFDTYLDRPVGDYYSGIPEGTTSLFGRSVNHNRVRGAGNMSTAGTTSLSGGQMQRLAVSRTFMRSLISEPKVGLLLFDEPSASLDPSAEHDLFERLRNLRGNKTMLFSSHRFGNLTRHADLILYINDAVVQEEGTHDELLRKQGQYAHVWNLQAQAFLP